MNLEDTIKEAAMNMRDEGLAVIVDTLRNVVKVNDSDNGARLKLEGTEATDFIGEACVLTQRYPYVGVGDVYAYLASRHF